MYWEPLFVVAAPFYTLAVLLVVSEGCKLYDDRQRSTSLTLDTIIREVNCTIEIWKGGNVHVLANTG